MHLSLLLQEQASISSHRYCGAFQTMSSKYVTAFHVLLFQLRCGDAVNFNVSIWNEYVGRTHITMQLRKERINFYYIKQAIVKYFLCGVSLELTFIFVLWLDCNYYLKNIPPSPKLILKDFKNKHVFWLLARKWLCFIYVKWKSTK